jgi:AcrR family transcriptional regulator
MPGNKRQRMDEILLTALACGASIEQAARKAGVSERTVYRRLRDPAFAQQLRAARADIRKRTSAALSAGSLEGARALLDLVKPAVAPTVRLGAARALLELSVKLVEAEEFEERLAALEQQLDKKKTKLQGS